MYKYIKIFLLALTLRLLCLGIIQYYDIPTLLTLEQTEQYLFSNNPPKELQLADASDYYYTSINLEVPKFLQEKWGYTKWYERNPLHTIVLHLTHRSILFQILLSCLTCVILFKINNIAGLIWCFYPQSIIYSNLLMKVTLMTFLFVLAMYLFRNKPYLIVLSFIFIQLISISAFHIVPHSEGIMQEFNRGIINKVFALWQPSFNHSPALFGNIIQYIQAPFYILLMFLFIRKTRFNYVWVIVIIMSIGAMVMYGHGYIREFILPAILVTVLEC